MLDCQQAGGLKDTRATLDGAGVEMQLDRDAGYGRSGAATIGVEVPSEHHRDAERRALCSRRGGHSAQPSEAVQRTPYACFFR